MTTPEIWKNIKRSLHAGMSDGQSADLHALDCKLLLLLIEQAEGTRQIPGGSDAEKHPRLILWDSNHPDRPVEWTNPGRPSRDGEIGYVRYDLFAAACETAAWPF